MTNKKPKRSNQSNAISRWDDEGGASSASDRSVRNCSTGIEQPVKDAVAPQHRGLLVEFGRPGKEQIGSSDWRPA
jgi:hypothetical protein